MIKVKPGKLQRYRILKGLSQSAFAHIIKINITSFCLMENGKMGARPSTAKAICEILGVEFDEIFEIVENVKGA